MFAKNHRHAKNTVQPCCQNRFWFTRLRIYLSWFSPQVQSWIWWLFVVIPISMIRADDDPDDPWLRKSTLLKSRESSWCAVTTNILSFSCSFSLMLLLTFLIFTPLPLHTPDAMISPRCISVRFQSFCKLPFLLLPHTLIVPSSSSDRLLPFFPWSSPPPLPMIVSSSFCSFRHPFPPFLRLLPLRSPENHFVAPFFNAIYDSDFTVDFQSSIPQPSPLPPPHQDFLSFLHLPI